MHAMVEKVRRRRDVDGALEDRLSGDSQLRSISQHWMTGAERRHAGDGMRRGCSWQTQPAPLALEGVRRRVNQPAAVVALEGPPIDIDSADIELGQALQRRSESSRPAYSEGGTQIGLWRLWPTCPVRTRRLVLPAAKAASSTCAFCGGPGHKCEPMREFRTAGVGREAQIGP